MTRRGFMAGSMAALVAANRSAVGQSADLTALSIGEAGRRIAAGALSSVDLTRAYLERIEGLNPRINAYITVTAQTALEQARALDAELQAGRSRGPLHGMPIGLKDNIDTAGVRTTAASAVYADRVPTQDAPVVQRLRAAGAVFLGKLNMHEFAYGGTSAVTHYGPVRNPWDLDYTPGGSSGGSAAAVAARLCAAALGTDTAASIRLPAAFCGVVGLKATHGLASIRGIVPLSEIHDHVGPLARSVADAALVMNALAGFDPLDPVSIEAPAQNLHSAIGADVSGLRLGVPREPFFANLDPEIAQITERAIGRLRELTRSLTDVTLPSVDSGPVLLADIYEYHAEMVADPARRGLYDPVTLERIMNGAAIPTTAYIASYRSIRVARNTIADAFRDVDALVTPVSMAMPSRIDDVLRAPAAEPDLIRNTLPFDVFGIPAISVPCGFTRAGLPVGLHIAGPRLGEARVLALAHAYEQATDWHLRASPAA